MTALSKGFIFSMYLVFALPFPAAHAQYTNTMNSRQFNNMYAANADFLMSQMIQQSQWRAMRMTLDPQVNRQRGQSQGVLAPAAALPPVGAFKLPLSATDFKPTGKRDAPEQLAAGATEAGDRQQLIEAGRTILKTVEATPGFRRNNLASAMTLLLAVSLQVHYGKEFSDAQSQVIMRQFNDLLGELPALKTLSAQKRTQMYDTFVVIGGFIAGIAQQGAESGNAELTKQANAMAIDALAQFGIKV